MSADTFRESSFIRSFIRSFVRSFVRSFIHSFIHSFIQSILGRWANHDHLTSSLKHILNQTYILSIAFGALMFVIGVAMIAGGEGKPLVAAAPLNLPLAT